jgi:hypothetical protein
VHISTTKTKSSFLARFIYRMTNKLDLDEVIAESQNYQARSNLLNVLNKNKDLKPTISQKHISTHIDSWEEFTIQHLYADMQTFQKAKKKILELDFVSDIKYYNNMASYEIFEKGIEDSVSTIKIDDYCITLTAWNISDGKAIDILTPCILFIEEFQAANK